MALDIKARFNPPAHMSSPIEAYCAIGTVAKALGLSCPERKDTLFEMRQELSDTETGKIFPSDRIEKINQILMSFIRNEETTDTMMDYVTYGYENENGKEYREEVYFKTDIQELVIRAASAEPEEETSTSWWWIAAGVVLLAIIGLVITGRRRR